MNETTKYSPPLRVLAGTERLDKPCRDPRSNQEGLIILREMTKLQQRVEPSGEVRSGGGSYYRYEIALQYFPESSPETARRRLNSWIKQNRQLSSALDEVGYCTHSKTFTRRQLELIYHYLGEP